MWYLMSSIQVKLKRMNNCSIGLTKGIISLKEEAQFDNQNLKSVFRFHEVIIPPHEALTIHLSRNALGRISSFWIQWFIRHRHIQAGYSLEWFHIRVFIQWNLFARIFLMKLGGRLQTLQTSWVPIRQQEHMQGKVCMCLKFVYFVFRIIAVSDCFDV